MEGIVAVSAVERFKRSFFQRGEQRLVPLILRRERDDGRRAAGDGGPATGREVVRGASLAEELGFCQVDVGVDTPGLENGQFSRWEPNGSCGMEEGIDTASSCSSLTITYAPSASMTRLAALWSKIPVGASSATFPSLMAMS